MYIPHTGISINVAKMYANVRKCTQMYANVRECTQMYIWVHLCTKCTSTYIFLPSCLLAKVEEVPKVDVVDVDGGAVIWQSPHHQLRLRAHAHMLPVKRHSDAPVHQRGVSWCSVVVVLLQRVVNCGERAVVRPGGNSGLLRR